MEPRVKTSGPIQRPLWGDISRLESGQAVKRWHTPPVAGMDPGGEILSWVNRIGQEKLLHYRESLHRKDLSLSHLAQQEKIFLALDQLHYYAHWITPEARSIRFDTRFFVALHPSGQEASHDQRETTHGLWITPRRALEGNSEKKTHPQSANPDNPGGPVPF